MTAVVEGKASISQGNGSEGIQAALYVSHTVLLNYHHSCNLRERRINSSPMGNFKLSLHLTQATKISHSSRNGNVLINLFGSNHHSTLRKGSTRINVSAVEGLTWPT